MPHITISYRRADSDATAGRIRDRLADYYGAESIFIDIDSIPVGVDFREQIKRELSKNDALLVVVGPKWRGAGKGGRARINDENDPVRVEVEAALARGIPVVPILVHGATMPKPNELPESLRTFSFHNAATVDSGQDFHPHMERLIRSLDRVLGRESAPPAQTGHAKSRLLAWAAIGLAVCLVAGAGAAGIWFYGSQQARNPSHSAPAAAQQEQPKTSAAPAVVSPQPSAAVPASTPPSGTAAPALPPSPARQSAVSQPPAAQTPAAPAPRTAGCKGSTATFEDDFKSPELGWSSGLGPRTTGSNAYFGDNRLVIKPTTKRGSRTIIYPSLVLKSAIICAMILSPDEINAPRTAGGVAFWAANGQNLYAFEVVTDGTYNITRLIDNNWSYIGSGLKSDAVNQGPGATNEIEVRIKQNVAQLFINGTRVQEIRGQPPATGVSTVGFVARNDTEQDYEWRFLNISVVDNP
jgi:hypothetical protein